MKCFALRYSIPALGALLFPVFLAFATAPQNTGTAKEPFTKSPAGHILVKVSINGEGPFLFVFDTGAETSIDRELADRLGLEQKGKTTVSDFVGTREKVPVYRADHITLLGREFKKVSMPSFQMIHLTNGCDKIKGLIGYDIMKDLNWQINFPESTIEVSEQLFHLGKGTKRIPLTGRSSAPEMNYSYGDMPSIPVLFDTGNPRIMTIPNYIMSVMDEEAFEMQEAPKYVTNTFKGLLGSVTDTLRYLVFPKITFGDMTFSNFPAVNSEKAMYTVGSYFFSDGVLSLNFTDKTIGYTPGNQAASKQMVLNSLGLTILPQEGAIKVAYIDLKGQAYEKGVRLGDGIVEINNQKATSLLQMNRCELLHFLEGLGKSAGRNTIKFANGKVVDFEPVGQLLPLTTWQ